jgi:hypothetical protein
MKKLVYLQLAVLVLLIGTSCTQEEDAFIRRDKWNMEFTYENQSKPFTVRSNRIWSVSTENDWITLSPESGEGAGLNYQNVNVTVATHYGGLDRSGVIILHSEGNDYTITVLQKTGPSITFGKPVMRGFLQQNIQIENVMLQIPYEGAIGGEQFTISVTASGPGAPGISPISNHPVTVSGRSGAIEVPLAGTPTAQGEVNFEITTSYTEGHPNAEIASFLNTVYPPLNVQLGVPSLSQTAFVATKRVKGLTLDIPYTDATPGVAFELSVNTNSGFANINNYPVTLNAASGTLSIPIQGTPVIAGDATFEIVYPGPPLPIVTATITSDGKKYYPGTILVTGVMADPKGNDAANGAVAWYNPSTNTMTVGGGNEYIQLMAVEDIDFSVTPYSVITAYSASNATVPADGWVQGGTRSYKFNLTSGTVARGEFFYVGGTGKSLNGTTTSASNVTAQASFDGTDPAGKVWTAYPIAVPAWAADPTYAGKTQTMGVNSFADAKWIRAKNLATETGDDGIGTRISEAGGIIGNAPNPASYPGSYGLCGIAVFEGTNVTSTTLPMDAVFWGHSAAGAANMTDVLTGYVVPFNDLYSPTNVQTGEAQSYLGQGNNSFFFVAGSPMTNFASPCASNSGASSGRDASNFLKFVGELDSDNSWVKSRVVKTLILLEPKHYLEHYGLSRQAQLSDIESRLPGADNYLGDNADVMVVRP